MYRSAQNEFASLPEESQPDNMASISANCMYDGLLYCYDNLDVFKLILLKSEGTKFSHMIDEMVKNTEEIVGSSPIWTAIHADVVQW